MDRQFAEWDIFPVAVVLAVVMLLLLLVPLGPGDDRGKPAHSDPVAAPAAEKNPG